MRTVIAAGRRLPGAPTSTMISMSGLEDFAVCLAIGGTRRAGRPYGLRGEETERPCGCAADPAVFGHNHERK